MPALSFFVDEHDIHMLIKRLNADPEIAYIVPDGRLGAERNGVLWSLGLHTRPRQRWRAVQAVEGLADGCHFLWHVPAGPLPLFKARRVAPLARPPDPPVPDPFAGWLEEQPGPDPKAPYFGPGCHPVMWIDLWTRHRPYTEAELGTLPVTVSWWTHGHDVLPASTLSWTGGHFRPAPAQTQRWWNRMRTWLGRVAVRLEAFPDGRQGVFWAFPSALGKLKGGMPYYAHDWPLDDAIHRAGS
jgi:hypothetical protein